MVALYFTQTKNAIFSCEEFSYSVKLMSLGMIINLLLKIYSKLFIGNSLSVDNSFDMQLVQESGSFHTTQKSKKSDFLKKSDFSMVWILLLSCTRVQVEQSQPLSLSPF